MKNKFLFKILMLLVVYILAITSILAPFMTVEGANKLLGAILAIVVSYAFVVGLATIFYKQLTNKK